MMIHVERPATLCWLLSNLTWLKFLLSFFAFPCLTWLSARKGDKTEKTPPHSCVCASRLLPLNKEKRSKNVNLLFLMQNTWYNMCAYDALSTVATGSKLRIPSHNGRVSQTTCCHATHIVVVVCSVTSLTSSQITYTSSDSIAAARCLLFPYSVFETAHTHTHTHVFITSTATVITWQALKNKVNTRPPPPPPSGSERTRLFSQPPSSLACFKPTQHLIIELPLLSPLLCLS